MNYTQCNPQISERKVAKVIRQLDDVIAEVKPIASLADMFEKAISMGILPSNGDGRITEIKALSAQIVEAIESQQNDLKMWLSMNGTDVCIPEKRAARLRSHSLIPSRMNFQANL